MKLIDKEAPIGSIFAIILMIGMIIMLANMIKIEIEDYNYSRTVIVVEGE